VKRPRSSYGIKVASYAEHPTAIRW
jgi:hypothetical protein